jgi:U3 small nucleolar RNA-associated protein 12
MHLIYKKRIYLVTGSADKNIKIWGLDFGDCHKSIFAHSDSIM